MISRIKIMASLVCLQAVLGGVAATSPDQLATFYVLRASVAIIVLNFVMCAIEFSNRVVDEELETAGPVLMFIPGTLGAFLLGWLFVKAALWFFQAPPGM